MRNVESVQDAVTSVIGRESSFGRYFAQGGMSPMWFRGQANSDWTLQPAIFRKNENGAYIYDEYQMLGEMQLMRPIEMHEFSTIFTWLVMCQHYGLPTRLLDWSESILVALYFAAEDDRHDGALFALRHSRLNMQTTLMRQPLLCAPTFPDVLLRAEQAVCTALDEVLHRVRESFSGYYSQQIMAAGGEDRLREIATRPVAVYPPRNNPRITQQGGMFTVHGGAVPTLGGGPDYGKTVAIEDIPATEGEVFGKMIVPAAAKEGIRRDLGRLGIHHGALFPEFEEQAVYLRERWSSR